MKSVLYVMVASIITGGIANAGDSAAVRVHIPAASLADAVNQWALQTGCRVVWTDEVNTTDVVPELDGTFTPRQALERLLRNTRLQAQFTDPHVAIISGGEQQAVTGKKISLRLAESSGNFPVADANSALAPVEEVLVTAQKREENLQEVPVPVTVVSAQSLIETGPLRIQDYYNQVPGLNITPALQDQSVLSVRGITTGQGGNRTVGVVVDDVPYGADINLAGGAVIPDLDPNDLARIEVLRGPQGTLYGASSMGGLLKFVTIDPSTDKISGRVQAGTSGVHNGNEPGYSFRGSVNVPITDTLAIRASALTRKEPGYIDNPIRGVDGVNEARINGGRLAALWRPSSDISLKVSALYQDYKTDGLSEVDRPNAGPPATFGLGDLQQNYGAGVGNSDRKLQAYSATLTAKIGAAELVAISGYNNNHAVDTIEQGYAFSTYTQPIFGVPESRTYANWATRRFSQELRLSGPIGSSFDWLIGGFYTHESAAGLYQNTEAYNYSTGEVLGQAWDIPFPSTYQEYAGFADLTWHFNDKFDVQVGGRESTNKQTLDEAFYGPLNLPFWGVSGDVIEPKQYSKDSSFTYLFTPRLKLTADVMVYARLASGYRPGGPNLNGVAIPARPDKTDNYEIGLKGDFIDHMLSVDTSIYYINWKNVQIALIDPVNLLTYLANGSGAKSEGIELSLTFKPWQRTILSGWVSFNNAVLTKDFPTTATIAEPAGTRLPEAAKFTGNLSVDQEFQIPAGITAFVGATGIYVGNRYGVFSYPRDYYPAYAQLNLRAGMKRDSWRVDAYLYNATDRRGVLASGLEASVSYGVVYTTPRTVGVNVSKGF